MTKVVSELLDDDAIGGGGGSTVSSVKTANYSVTEDDNGSVIPVDATAAALTVTLLSASTAGNGFRLIVKKTDTSDNTVTIDADGSETIDGALTYTLTLKGQTVTIICDGTSFYVIEERGTVITGFNANGYFAKYADGTLECWGRDYSVSNLSNNANATFTYTPPYAFSTAPQNISANLQHNGGSGGITSATVAGLTVDVSAFPAAIYVRIPRVSGTTAWASSQTVLINVRAIGRWFEV